MTIKQSGEVSIQTCIKKARSSA